MTIQLKLNVRTGCSPTPSARGCVSSTDVTCVSQHNPDKLRFVRKGGRGDYFGTALRDVELLSYLYEMLTFLRRIRRSLIESGSAHKYLLYALGEILLVMIGILLALQVNNWNQERIENRKEKLLLIEINKEFKYNKEEIQSTVYGYKRVRQFCTYMQQSFPITQTEIYKDTLAKYLEIFRNLSTSDLSMGSISTLINTSTFDIISNQELRSLLIQWKDLVSDLFERETQAIEYTRQIIIPYLAKRIPQPYGIGIDDERVDLSFMKTIEFENMINDRLRDSNTLLNVVEGKRSKIEQALERIIVLSQPND